MWDKKSKKKETKKYPEESELGPSNSSSGSLPLRHMGYAIVKKNKSGKFEETMVLRRWESIAMLFALTNG